MAYIQFPPSGLIDEIPFGQFQRVKRILVPMVDIDINAQDLRKRAILNICLQNSGLFSIFLFFILNLFFFLLRENFSL